MKKIQLVIDDKTIIVPEGTNIFQAALDNDISIPGLCYHPKLSQFGGCRLCMVEVTEKRTRHRFACAHPVSEGMTVKVNTPEVTRYRKAVMEYLLAQHPLDCPTCDKSGECGLQNITHDLSLSESRFKTVRMNAPMIRDNPLLELNRNRCILCSRCVSTCKEIAGDGSIDFQNRGIKTVVGTAFDRPLNCSFCGGCVAVCPTGAWQNRTLGFHGRSWEFEKISTICTYCAVGCTLVLNTKRGSVRRITSDDRLGINEGNLCVKGRFGHEFIHSTERIKTPFMRRDNKLHPATWDEAIDYIAKNFRNIIQNHGDMSIGGIGSEKCTNEANYLFQKFCRSVLKTNHIDNLANMRSPFLNGLIYESVMNGTTTTSLKDLQNANLFFFFGADISEAHPVIGGMVRKAIRMNNANLIIANARNIIFHNTAKNDLRLRYTLGSQTVLINALLKVIKDKILVNVKRAERNTNNLKELYASLDTVNINEAVKVTNIPEETITNVALSLVKSKNCRIICGKDITDDPNGEKTIQALINLCTLINAPHDTDKNPPHISIVFSRSHNNSQGVNDMGVTPEFFPGYLDIQNASNREKVEKLWNVELHNALFTKDHKNIIDSALQNKLKALYIMGENLMVNYPRGKEVQKALGNIDFLVVQDTFLTETAQMANVVLPMATYAENEGTFTNMGMTVQRINKAIQPIGEAKCDWEIICDLAKKMGYPYSYASPKEIVSEIESLSPMYSGINFDRLKRKEFHWASSAFAKNKPSNYTFRVIQSDALDTNAMKNSDFPFILLTGANLNHLGTYSRYSKALTSVVSECFVEINRKDADKMQLQDGDTVIVESLQGKLPLPVKVTIRPPEGCIYVSEDFEKTPLNSIRYQTYTPVKIYKETD
ncbi:MAG: molybdopterin-dependent oxidoreductase [Candidatus Brocadiaceae bacterium]|nr:molybdopterin-dependent oxidoreductase [Candidatus Brocadiaceae bacterium]